jgi:uncharacterized coiled-coil DUF342 family protein
MKTELRDTPETDAAADWYLAAAYSTDPEDRTVPLAVSRKLERERDEAIRQLNNIKAIDIHTCHDQCKRPMCVLRRERDEARHEIEGWRNKWECAVDMAARAEVERDEARAQRDSFQALSQSLAEACVKLKAERDEWAKLCGQYKQERDEARAKP